MLTNVSSNSSTSITDTDRYIIWTGIVVFNIFGLFGNFNLVYAHYRVKELRTKYGILLTMLVSAHSICLLYELLSVAYNVSVIVMKRRACFFVIAPYACTYCFQLGVMAAIATDILISIAAPFQHRTVRTKPYLAVLVLPGIVYGITALVVGIVDTEDEEIKICNLPASFPFHLTKIWRIVGFVFTLTTIALYASAVAIIYRKCKNNFFNNGKIERKAMKSLTIIIIVFICERLIFITLMNIVDFSWVSMDVIQKAQAYMVFSALMVYSSTFYVCFARSSEYRRLFWPQIVGIFGCCGIKLNEDRFGTPSTDESKKKNSSRQYMSHPKMSDGKVEEEYYSSRL